jgi:hypothetical protein
MIAQKKITTEWLDEISKKTNNTDKILIEKVIRAFLLVEGLVKMKLPFIFKGGTSLMLHLNSTKRLSIDIDIIISQEMGNLDELLNAVVKEQGFLKYEMQQRISHSRIKKNHFKFFYSPVYKTNRDQEFVLLDILFEKVNYSKIVSLPVQSMFVPDDGKPLHVDLPDRDNLLGDKMTAFAPNTTGIPYFKSDVSMSMEIIKQLYDIGYLFDQVADTDVISIAFQRFAKTELSYRNIIGLTENDVLEDIYQTALCLTTRGLDGKGNFQQLQDGVKRMRLFIFSENYHIEKAIIHASKAAYLSVLIKQKVSTIQKFDDPSLIKDWLIGAPMNSKLNKLKKSNPEAFFYWHKIFELIR